MSWKALVGVLTALHAAVVLAPAVVLAAAARKGGLAWAHGLDLVAASAAVAALHAWFTWRRLREVDRSARIDAAVASVNALVVLTVLVTALVFVTLGGLAADYTAILNKGWHVIVLWAALQVVAVAATAAAHRGLRAWLRRGAELRTSP